MAPYDSPARLPSIGPPGLSGIGIPGGEISKRVRFILVFAAIQKWSPLVESSPGESQLIVAAVAAALVKEVVFSHS